MNLTDSNASHWGRIQADACRRMWAAVVLGAYYDWWREAAKARAKKSAPLSETAAMWTMRICG